MTAPATGPSFRIPPAEEILPDPQSREMVALWQRDPRGLERQLAQLAA